MFPELPDGFQGSLFKGRVREGHPSVCDQLVHNSLVDGEVTGRCHGSSPYQSLGASRSGGYVLMVIR